jgi:hypothetical protein
MTSNKFTLIKIGLLFMVCISLCISCSNENNGTSPEGVTQEDAGTENLKGVAADTLLEAVEANELSAGVNSKDYIPITKDEKEEKTDVVPPCNDVQRAEIASRKKFISEMEESLADIEDPADKEAFHKNIESSKKALASMVKSYNCN